MSINIFLYLGIPDSPTNITVLNTTSRSVSLLWDVPHNGNSHITGSIVQYQTVSGKFNHFITYDKHYLNKEI